MYLQKGGFILKAKVQKWGNSMALRLPKPIVQEVGMKEGGLVDLSVSRGKLLVLPIKKPEYSLKKLLKAIRPQNIHREIDTGQPVGNEIW